MYNIVKRIMSLAGLIMLLVTACPSPVEPEAQETRYAITIKNAANGAVSSGRETAKAGEIITLTILPKTGYKLASVRVTGLWDIALDGSGNTRTFVMPAEDVTVNAVFTAVQTGPIDPTDPTGPTDPVAYGIRIGTMTGGVFDSIPADSQYEDELVTLIAKPDTGKKYRPGSLKVMGRESGEEIKTTPEEGSETAWTFTMPSEDVAVDAGFIDEETELYGIIITQPANGRIECGQSSAVAGDTVTITLTIDDTADYRYKKDSLSITGAGGGTVHFAENGIFRWNFTMPAENITIDAAIEFIPYYGIVPASGSGNGSFSITGVETDGPYEGKARKGTPITITAIPAAGYKLTDNVLFVTPVGAVTFARVEGQPVWTFDMPDTNLEIGIEFAELGLLDIYKGGARRGITVGELSDDKKYFANSINMENEEPGRNGNQRTIKITHALNANGKAAQQSFGLFSDTEIDLENAAALSFWARANKQLNIRYVGFGDADPDKRVVYTGENYNQAISVGAEWKRYVIPVPASRSGQKTTRAFFFNAALAIDNYVCIDDIEFVQTGVTLTEITVTGANNRLFYGATDAVKLLKGAPLKLTYTCDDGSIVTLQNASNSHTLKYNLTPWLLPFIGISGNITFSDSVITPKEKGNSNALTFSVNIPGARGNSMTAHIIDGLLLDDFENVAGAGSITIPGTPADNGTGYRWQTTSSGSVVVQRDYVTTAHQEIYSGLRAGSWRPAKDANKPRGGRNFDAKNAANFNTLTFRIKVTVGGGNTVPQKNTVFTFELRNGGTLTNKTSGSFFAQQFTYDADGWQEVTMPLADFAALGLDITAITGYAFGVVDNQGSALRIMLDDIALVYEG